MKLTSTFIAAAVYAAGALAQVALPYTDPETGITTQRFSTTQGGGYSFGVVFPENPTSDSEFIGQLVGPNNGGWAGVSFGGSMPNNLLFVAWPNGNDIVFSTRMAFGYIDPNVYEDERTVITPLHKKVNETHFSLTFRCQGCTKWGEDRGFDASGEFTVMGWAQADMPPVDPADPDSPVMYHNNGFGQYGVILEQARSAEYQNWIDAGGDPEPTTTTPGPTEVPTTTPVTTTTTTTTPTVAPTGKPVPTGKEYDYIVIGGGAGGLVAADRLSESGKSVLLIERGPPSTYAHGGRSGPAWLNGQSLTRFDVPGLCNQIWVDSAGIACNDIDQMAGCVLGGGTAVNAGLFFKPPARDWDYNFPSGWKSSDMTPAVNKVFQRIPSTDTPSTDGRRYLQEGHNVLSQGLTASGWRSVTANQVPEQKNRTFAHTPYMFSNGERGGPLATYLVSAKRRSNFEIVTDTMVQRIVRREGVATGVDVEPTSNNGYKGTYKLKNRTGRVILSAGVFGTAKILFRSGIGPEDALSTVAKSADKDKLIDKKYWINLPVGYNAMDHINTDVVVSHPAVVPYDFYEAWDEPIAADKDAYLSRRAGVLATAAPGPNTMIWDQVRGTDGVVRHLQWTVRVEGSLGMEGDNLLTMSQYLGTGFTTRGRISITEGLNMITSVSPYNMNDADLQATVQGVANLQAALSRVPNLTWIYPAPGQSAADYVSKYTGGRRSNHWMGTAKIGTDDGRTKGGKSGSVVDLNTKVYGTENIFVVDASIFPGHITANPSAAIMAVAEKASEKINALPYPQAAAKYEQCGGLNYNGPKFCQDGLTCTFIGSDYYWQCL